MEGCVKNNVRIYAAKIVQGYKVIRVDIPFSVKISEGWGERALVKQLVYLKGIPNHSSKVSIHVRWAGFGAGWRGSMIEVEMMGMESVFYCINPLNWGWQNNIGVGDVKEVSIIYV